MTDSFTLRLDDQLCFALYAATNAVTRSYRPRLDSVGLTYPQYLVMLVLWQDGASAIGHIAARLKLPPNGITPLVDRLESVGFVLRERDEKDRRITRIVLTDEGAALENAAALQQHQVACETGMAPGDLAELRDELRALVERMEGQLVPQPEGTGKLHNPVQPANAKEFV